MRRNKAPGVSQSVVLPGADDAAAAHGRARVGGPAGQRQGPGRAAESTAGGHATGGASVILPIAADRNPPVEVLSEACFGVLQPIIKQMICMGVGGAFPFLALPERMFVCS